MVQLIIRIKLQFILGAVVQSQVVTAMFLLLWLTLQLVQQTPMFLMLKSHLEMANAVMLTLPVMLMDSQNQHR